MRLWGLFFVLFLLECGGRTILEGTETLHDPHLNVCKWPEVSHVHDSGL